MQDFLGLGCQTGYFCLEQLLYRRRATIDHIAHPEQPFQASVEEQETLELLRTTFALTPWENVEQRFDELNENI